MPISTIPPLVLAGGAFLIQGAVSPRGRATTSSKLLGGGLAAASLALGTAAVLEFRRKDTTVDPVDVDHVSSLVRTGVLSATGNPMYLGMAGMLAAHALARRSWLAALPVAGFIVAIDRRQIPAEEEALARQFGPDYEAYVLQASRWLGQRSIRAVSDRLGIGG